VKIVDYIDIHDLIDRLTDRQRREFALWCAERVRHLMTDSRSTDALDVAARHLRGEATDRELAVALAAAGYKAGDAAWAAAWYAVRAAARDAAWASAWAAVRAAERDAALDVAWDAAGAAARDTERAAQRAELERMLGEVKS